MNRNKMMQLLETEFPKMWTKPAEMFGSGYDNKAIWTGENSFDNEGLEMFNYWSQDHKETLYVMGVRKTLHDFLSKHGWYAEAHDAGTYFLMQD